jgi:hypothetical protein
VRQRCQKVIFTAVGLLQRFSLNFQFVPLRGDLLALPKEFEEDVRLAAQDTLNPAIEEIAIR